MTRNNWPPRLAIYFNAYGGIYYGQGCKSHIDAFTVFMTFARKGMGLSIHTTENLPSPGVPIPSWWFCAYRVRI